jgi:hypothetical protein
MKIAQQIVGVNQRLGNTAVPNMQGTTRVIFDTRPGTGQNQTLEFFNGVSSRLYPLSNINQNKFEVGESLAITSIALGSYTTATPTLATELNSPLFQSQNITCIFNLYIGNQRVLKDIELVYGGVSLGETNLQTTPPPVIFRLESPIVIPPQIEFYATAKIQTTSSMAALSFICALMGQGTLLNTKSTF